MVWLPRFLSACLMCMTTGGLDVLRPQAQEITYNLQIGDERGELVFLNTDGQITHRYTGLGDPVFLYPVDEQKVLVTDRSKDQLILLDPNANPPVIQVIASPLPLEHLITALPLPEEQYLVTAGHHGLGVLNRQGEIVWRTANPFPDSLMLTALPLGNNVFICTLLNPANRMEFLFLKENNEFTPVDTSVLSVRSPVEPKLTFSFNGGFYLYDHAWQEIYHCRLAGKQLELIEKIPALHIDSLFSDNDGGVVWTREQHLINQVQHWKKGRFVMSVETQFHNWSAIIFPSTSRYAYSFQRQKDTRWPDDKWPLGKESFPWSRFRWWLALGLAAGVIFHTAQHRTIRFKFSALQFRSRGFRDLLHVKCFQKPRSLYLMIAGIGFFIALWAQTTVSTQPNLGSILVYIVGAATAGLALEKWRKQYTASAAKSLVVTEPHQKIGKVQITGCALITLSCFYLHYLRSDPQKYVDQIGLWVVLILALLGLSFPNVKIINGWKILTEKANNFNDNFSYNRLTESPLSIPYPDILLPVILVITGLITLGYQIDSVPYSLHFDQMYYAIDALHWWEGRVGDMWRTAFSGAPVIGRIPEVFGVTLFGITRKGIAIGAILQGLSGLVAVYFLGKAYFDRGTGFLAGLFLAGNPAYIHYIRLNHQGETIVASLWAITFLVLALRHGSLFFWVLSGFSMGYCFFLWPASRITPLLLFAFTTLLLIKERRRLFRVWHGPFLMILAFLVCLTPLFYLWLLNEDQFLPRGNSLSVYKLGQGVDYAFLRQSFGMPFLRCLDWMYVSGRLDPHNFVTPAANSLEAVLFTIGLVIFLVEGFSLNIFFLAFIYFVLLVLGAWSIPPQYPRIALMVPIASLAMARSVTGIELLLSNGYPDCRGAIRLLIACICLLASPVYNFSQYYQRETTEIRTRNGFEVNHLGHILRERYQDYPVYLVASNFHNIWSIPNGSTFHQLLMYVSDRNLTKVNDLSYTLPRLKEEKAVVVVLADRIEKDWPLLERNFPEAQVEKILSPTGKVIAQVAILDTVPSPKFLTGGNISSQ